MSLSDALNEIKSEIKNGTTITDSLIEEIAKDNSVHPNLLRTKMNENNINAETILKFAEATSENVHERTKKAFTQLCKTYGVPSTGTFKVFSINGDKYIICCRTYNGRRAVVLNLTDLKGYTFPVQGFIRQAKSTTESFDF